VRCAARSHVLPLKLFDLTLAVLLVEREGAGDDDLARRGPERGAVPGIVFPLKMIDTRLTRSPIEQTASPFGEAALAWYRGFLW